MMNVAQDEARQMEEILQLEREIERLQKKREDGVSQLCESSKQELQLRRDAELKRMKKEASRKATELIDLLNFGGVDPEQAAASNKPAAEVTQVVLRCCVPSPGRHVNYLQSYRRLMY